MEPKRFPVCALLTIEHPLFHRNCEPQEWVPKVLEEIRNQIEEKASLIYAMGWRMHFEVNTFKDLEDLKEHLKSRPKVE